MSSDLTARALWARADGDGSDAVPAARVREALRGTGLVVTASVDGRTAFVTLIHRVTLITAAVLGLTLLITLSGLANTTDVSVLERTRKIGVLRTTGTGRAQVRGLFLTEAVFVVLLGGLIGVALGAAIGLAGVAALMGTQAGSGLNLQLPWLALMSCCLVRGYRPGRMPPIPCRCRRRSRWRKCSSRSGSRPSRRDD